MPPQQPGEMRTSAPAEASPDTASGAREGANGHERRSDPRVVAMSMLLTVACTLPLWLTGALAVQMRAELGFGIVALGGAVALHRIAGAAVAVPLGRLADRLGPTPAMRMAAGLAAVSAIGVAALARDWLTLVLFLAISGASNPLGQTAANLALVRAVRQGRQGIAFGVKQAALPSAAMVAGITVPAVALTVGWRWAFAGAGVVALLVAAAVPRARGGRYQRPTDVRNRGYGRGPLLVLALSLFFGMGASQSLTTFTVESSSAAGMSAGSAGLVLTMGSALAIATRLIAGHRADRREGGHIRGVALMQLAGAVGLLGIGLFDPPLMLVGTAIAFTFAWGYNGLFWFAIARLNPATPARATGAVMPGGMLGGVAGPLAFGWLAETVSYSAAWLGAASWGLLAGLLMLLGRHLLRADLRVSDQAA